MADESLKNILKNMTSVSVLVLGDIMLDRFVYGHVDRISPESPVPVLAINREDRMLGGAGNALANLAGLKTNAHIVSVVGDDDEAALVKEHIEKLGFKSDGLITDNTRPTTIKSRFLAGHQQLLRTDFEHKKPISDEIAKKIIEAVKAKLGDVKAFIISDYGKGLLRKEVLADVIKAARDQNIPVIVDPKGQDFSIYKGASVVTPNKKELSEAVKGASLSNDEEVIAAANTIINDCGIEAVLATRSAEGMSVIQKGEKTVHIKTKDIEVFDVSGAGDTVIATLAAALAAGASLVEAANLANMAGSVVVQKVGTASIRNEELLDIIQNGDHKSNESRTRQGDIFGQTPDQWNAAAEQIKRWKARGLKVGFTNGCFDILHYGHVSYLNNTREHCDRLVMGLNNDASISILKGPERPIHDEHSRAAVLAALGSIDMVVMFGAEKQGDDNTAIKLIETLKPDIYFKGGDYTEDQIPEAPAVRKGGGEVKVMPVYEGHSTTNSITKMKDGKAA